MNRRVLHFFHDRVPLAGSAEARFFPAYALKFLRAIKYELNINLS